MRGRLIGGFGALLLLDFAVLVVMLSTDKNLQTDFGAVSPYYLHWYGVLVIAAVTGLFGFAVLGTLTPSMAKEGMFVRNRYSLIGATVWAGLVIVAMLAVLASYKQVGFSSPSQFAQYLFGVSPYRGALSYIPWLYDLLLAILIVTVSVGVFSVMQFKRPASAPQPTHGRPSD